MTSILPLSTKDDKLELGSAGEPPDYYARNVTTGDRIRKVIEELAVEVSPWLRVHKGVRPVACATRSARGATPWTTA